MHTYSQRWISRGLVRQSMKSRGRRTRAGANDRDDDHDEIDEGLEVLFSLGG